MIYIKMINMDIQNKNIRIFEFDTERIPPEQAIDTKVKKLVFDDLHGHEYVEIFYIISGNGLHVLNGDFSRSDTGDVYIVLPNDLHRHVKDHTSNDFLYRDILIKLPYFQSVCRTYYESLWDDFFNKSIPQHISLAPSNLFLLENIFLQYSNASDQEKRKLSNLIVHNFIIFFLNNKSMQKSKQYPNWLLTLISELNRPSNFTVPLQKLVASFHYTNSYICKVFRKHVGTTVTDYFNRNRITYANSLLNTTDYSIEYICSISGFNNIAYFYSLYKKFFNTTPRKNSALQQEQKLE